jgi:hypothetical protein
MPQCFGFLTRYSEWERWAHLEVHPSSTRFSDRPTISYFEWDLLVCTSFQFITSLVFNTGCLYKWNLETIADEGLTFVIIRIRSVIGTLNRNSGLYITYRMFC